MLTKEKAIVLRASDYKEKDKIVTLFSLENGLIKAVLKGIKSEKAKLKFASMPFCFAEFELTKGAGLSIVSGATLIESFFDITTDISAFYAGCSVLKLIENISSFGEQGNQLFVLTLKTLKAIMDFVYLKSNNQLLLRLIKIKFILSLCELNGTKINLTKCASCGKLTHDEVYFDHSQGNALCSKCCESSCALVPTKIIALIILIEKSDFDTLTHIKSSENDVMSVETLVFKSFEAKTSCKFE
ncbi:MAG: DNA repair protein RecO [Clostridia bacterium]